MFLQQLDDNLKLSSLPFVFISGSKLRSGEKNEIDRFSAICRSIGEVIANLGCGIVGCPPHLSRVLASQEVIKGASQVDKRVITTDVKVEFPLDDEERARFTKIAKAAIFIGGGYGTLEEYTLCLEAGIMPLLPIGGAGGISQRLARRMLANPHNFMNYRVKEDVIAMLASSSNEPVMYSRAIDYLLKLHFLESGQASLQLDNDRYRTGNNSRNHGFTDYSPANSPQIDDTPMSKKTHTKILFLGANPIKTARLRLDQEVREIQKNLKIAKGRDKLEFKQEWAVTTDTLIQAVLDEAPGVIHFSGHGKQEGIYVEDEGGGIKLITTEALSCLFEVFKDHVQCVILNACYSEEQAKAIKLHVPYVIGMKSSISDKGAIAFSAGFYKAIGAGKDFSFAFKLGIAAVKLGYPPKAGQA